MRALWLTILTAGLLLATIDAYDNMTTTSVGGVAPCLMDDGSGYPTPNPPPTK